MTKEGKENLKLKCLNWRNCVQKIIVTPCEMFMEEFLRLFGEKYGDTENYFRSMGLCDGEIQRLRSKLV